ncbi:MAG TPA: hypothetical protein VGL53_19705 [Bryobacteraceae bacterium]
MDWNTIAGLVREAFRIAVNEWIGKARIEGGKVSGPTAVLTPGTLSSETNIEARMLQILSNAQVPRNVAAAFSAPLAAAWNEWAAGFQIQLPKAYPAFAAFPGHFAPPTPAAVAPTLSKGSSTGEVALKAPFLASRLNAALSIYKVRGDSSSDKAVAALTTWVEASFTEWKNLVAIVGVLGTGPAPTYAPPYVPVAPVVGGQNVSLGSPFAGPRFGKVVLG